MDLWQLLGSTLGLGFLVGIRLYLTVFLLGAAIRVGWFVPHGSFAHLAVLSDGRVLTIAGLATLLEFFADKVPWIDSIWDAVHTFIRPVAAAVIGLSVAGDMDPAWKVAIVLLSGTVALSGHTVKAGTRLLANHSPEPFSNIALSFMEDAAVPVGLWMAAQHPLIMLAVVLVFLGLFLWLAPKVFRLVRSQWRALANRWNRATAG